jgi:hypothetical protein
VIEARHYLSEVKTRLATSAAITVVEVVAEGSPCKLMQVG